MDESRIIERYFQWLLDIVCDSDQKKHYQALFHVLFETEFTWILDHDANRAADGIDLRPVFAEEKYIDYMAIRGILGPCRVLEMMVALAKRCEDSIMGDSKYGDRTPKWFWIMVENIDLDSEDDGRIDIPLVEGKIKRFLDRKYSFDGVGGLFYIENPPDDLRKVEIWYQLNWFLNTIVD